jgi:hypothetical protein
MGELTKLGWLIEGATREMRIDSLHFLEVVFSSTCTNFNSFQTYFLDFFVLV